MPLVDAPPASATGAPSGPFLCHWRTWGTRVTLAVTDAAMLHPARVLLDEKIAEIDATCNRFTPETDVSRCNRSAGDWVPVSPPFLDTLGVALDAARTTDGLVDPTVGSALAAIGYDRDFDELRAGIAGAASRPTTVTGWDRVEVDRRRCRVRIPEGSALDLGATAKALCVDGAVGAMSRRGIGALVEIGGDLAVAGPLPVGGWRITVQESSRDQLDPFAPVVTVSQGAVATSGTTLRRWTVGGRRVHHIIDPTTGEPARPVWRMVTVAASSCVDANTAATAAVVRASSALAALGRDQRPARLVDAAGQVFVVGGWPADPPNPADAKERADGC